MSVKQIIVAAVSIVAASRVLPAAGQALPVPFTVIQDTPVVLLPAGEAEFSGVSPSGAIDIDVSTSEGLRTYSTTFEGRTYRAYADLSGTPVQFAFDPAQRRFRAVSPTVRVELHDYGHLDAIAREHGAFLAKAYPHLGFALIGLGAATDAADAVEFLSADPRVRRADLQFKRPPQREPRRPALNVRSASGTGVRATPRSVTLNSGYIDFLSPAFKLDLPIWGVGEDATLVALLLDSMNRLYDADEEAVGVAELYESATDAQFVPIPALGADDAPYTATIAFPLNDLMAGHTYHVLLATSDADLTAETIDDETVLVDPSWTGFTLDSLNRVQHVCVESGRGSVDGAPDPLLANQWNLVNTGQRSYAETGGTTGEDVNMAATISVGPTGEGVRVAVVDEGLEICHPDLRANVEDGASFNFNARLSPVPDQMQQSVDMAGLNAADPFYYKPHGDHGTSVASIIAAEADNGIGIRGVAPGVRLRGYNYLSADEAVMQMAYFDSLGASTYAPDSSDVDIFNMSLGSNPEHPINLPVDEERLFAHGTRSLRFGLGAIYVKSAGNEFTEFGDCDQTETPNALGCFSSTHEPTHNLPYLIVVGAFNAAGKKSSYSNAGANLWISAPGGEYGLKEPAVLAVDQMGGDRGSALEHKSEGYRTAPLDDESAVNPDGDYTALMNGTSAAAPHVSGAAAVLLEAVPGLSWRGVKHVLANSARRIDPGIEPIEESFGGNARTLRPAWTRNAAGYWFHNWYGFGALDLDAALRFARDHEPLSLGEFRQSGWFDDSMPLDIPDNDGRGAVQTVRVAGMPADANIEAVVLEWSASHQFSLDELGVHLVSPHGTRSVVNQVFGTILIELMEVRGWRQLSNAFYGENPNGTWQIEVFDGAEADAGTLDAWRLRFYYGDHP